MAQIISSLLSQQSSYLTTPSHSPHISNYYYFIYYDKNISIIFELYYFLILICVSLVFIVCKCGLLLSLYMTKIYSLIVVEVFFLHRCGSVIIVK